MVHLVVLACVLRATTKKGQLFGEKVHPRQKPGYAYELPNVLSFKVTSNFVCITFICMFLLLCDM